AVQNDLVGIAVRDGSWVGLPRGDAVAPVIRTGINRSLPLGSGTTGYPYVGTDVAISPIFLSITGFTVAPAGAGQGQQNVALLQLELKTNSDFVNLAAIRLDQIGTVLSTTTGQGDFSNVSVWLDNRDRVFTPQSDTRLGSTAPATSAGVWGVTVPLAHNGIPYLRVTTAATVLFVSADIGYYSVDGNNAPTLNHQAGLRLNHFSDLLAPNGAPVAAAPDPAKRPPYESRTVTIMPLSVPSVSISSSAVPIIVTRSQAGVPGHAVGFPAFAEVDAANCNNGGDLTNMRNNICRDAHANPIPDQDKWLCKDGRQWLSACPGEAPLLDVNGDGIPDNFSVGESTRPLFVSLIGDGVPARDLTNTGVLDMDLNQDGIVDMVFNNGFGGVQIMLGNDVTDQGNAAKATPVPDQGFVPSAWSAKSGEIRALLPMISATGYYQVAVGEFYDNPASFSGSWSSVTLLGGEGSLSVQGLGVQETAPTTAKVGNLTIPIPGTTRLAQALTQDTTVFAVADAAALNLPGVIFVGSEIMRAEKVNASTLRVVALDNDPPPGNGRGLRGSAPIVHMSNEPVSDRAAIIFARFVSVDGASQTVSAARPILFYRPDPAPPSAPGPVQPLEQGKPSYALRWNAANPPVSGVLAYEVQERGGEPDNIAAAVLWRTLNLISGKQPSYTVGDPNFPGEGPRPASMYYGYRVRALSGAGVFSPWSPLGANVNTGVANDIISGVSNYPNPFDTRKGGASGKTTITYILGADSDVTITIYDLLGYVVKTLSYGPAVEGGKAGPNFVEWDGRNGSGVLVSKGGYIARIKVKSPNGSSTVIRKIGVIH
ncbi:MAG: FlgD immunoglobulin-like domain containing protein, partial [Elusimicrobia bacterium]|nr:FlgD immunoglobulin-like domain containing protein [Elusimicrobiota bacterium]